MEKTYDVKEVAELLKISEQSVRLNINSDRLRAFKLGKKWHIPKSSIEKYKNSNLENELVFLHRKKALTNSLIVAEAFKKRHNHVLQSIKELEKKGLNFQFWKTNFRLSTYVDTRGKEQPVYKITRDGFVLLVMGFTGKKAMDWKIKYIQAFNAMEDVLSRQANQAWNELRKKGIDIRFELTDEIKIFVEYSKKQGSKSADKYYIHITNASYKALFLIKIKSDKQFRNMLDNMQLTFLQTAEFIARNALREGMKKEMNYKDIYKFARDKVQAFGEMVGKTTVIMKKQLTEEQLKLIEE